ncbi:DUF1289 domain-containing protein [Polymorphobacter arshaanensis]|uniref:DUF1289 domain-containing protein n=1 Tax=Glacieibacterium arshaanense TaxID=2511025 RepID=A0A4Y9ELM9_9SPHN|nr:DUF1289 domain-containing protein [Polymorphobacter arshaanensis]TFU02898.1 DUF1289 domain-containing protein [Polymorphobacter arshaanensis]
MAVRSPCNNVCTIDRRSGWCAGCARTVDEITRWPLASEAERVAIVAALPQRRAILETRKRWWRR